MVPRMVRPTRPRVPPRCRSHGTDAHADASGGAFLTEKTFKPIAYMHPFNVCGSTGTLELLKKNGFEFSNYKNLVYDARKI